MIGAINTSSACPTYAVLPISLLFWSQQETPSHAALDIKTFHPKNGFCGMIASCLLVIAILNSAGLASDSMQMSHRDSG